MSPIATRSGNMGGRREWRRSFRPGHVSRRLSAQPAGDGESATRRQRRADQPQQPGSEIRWIRSPPIRIPTGSNSPGSIRWGTGCRIRTTARRSSQASTTFTVSDRRGGVTSDSFVVSPAAPEGVYLFIGQISNTVGTQSPYTVHWSADNLVGATALRLLLSSTDGQTFTPVTGSACVAGDGDAVRVDIARSADDDRPSSHRSCRQLGEGPLFQRFRSLLDRQRTIRIAAARLERRRCRRGWRRGLQHIDQHHLHRPRLGRRRVGYR